MRGMNRPPLQLTAWEKAELAKMLLPSIAGLMTALAILIAAIAALSARTPATDILPKPENPVIRHHGSNATMPDVIGVGHG
jgi:hypothetical protein